MTRPTLKGWRARGIAAEAMAAAAAGDPEKAIRLFDEAAIHALRQVVRSGDASPADCECLCRLALDSGQAELAHGPTLQAWGQASPDTFSVTQLRLRAVLQGRRNPGQRLIETGLWDEPSETAATYLQTWVKPGQAP